MRQRGRTVEEENGLTKTCLWDIVSQDSGRMEKHVVNVKFNVVALKSQDNDKALRSFSGPLIHRFAVKVQSQAVKNGLVKILSDGILNSPFKLFFKQPSSFYFSIIIIAVVRKKKTLLYAEASNSTFFRTPSSDAGAVFRPPYGRSVISPDAGVQLFRVVTFYTR